MIEVTVFTPFAPRRAWTVDVYREALKNLHLPMDKTRLLVLDNRGIESDDIRDLVYGMEPAEVHYLIDRRVLSPTSNPHARAFKMGDLWALASPFFVGETILSLESDNLPPEGTYPRLLKAIEENSNAGSMATIQHSRVGRTMQIYRLVDGVSGFRLKTMAPGVGAAPVGSTHLGCTLFRSSFLRTFNFRERWSRGFDFLLMKRMHQGGLVPYVHWDLRSRHYRTATTFL